MVLTKILEKSVLDYPNKVAVTMQMGYRVVNLTYAQVYELAKKTAMLLAANGINAGDCVVVYSPNSPFWVCLFWGCVLQGVVLVPLMPQSTQNLVNKVFDQTKSKAFFTSRGSFLHSPEGAVVFVLELLDEYLKPFDVAKFAPVAIESGDLVQIMYTSGTTGEPKGVMLTHQNLYSDVEAISRIFRFKIKKHERILSVLPLSHIFEQTIGFLLPFFYGIQIVYAHSHAAIPHLIKEYKITKIIAVPEFLKVMMSTLLSKSKKFGLQSLLLGLMNLSAKINFPVFSRLIFSPLRIVLGRHLNLIACGGAPLDPDLEKKWNAIGIRILQGYGLTETSPVIACDNFGLQKFGAVGKPVDGVHVKLAEDGEILVKGLNVFCGYYKDEARTKEAFTSDGWFKTGDLGLIDKDGFLFIKGRKKYMIKGAGAQNIYPEDIEAELNIEPDVKDCCVLGFEHVGGTVDIHAVLLAPKAVSPEGLIKRANSRLAPYQRITSWSLWPMSDFPRTATLKIKKEEVRKFLQIQKAEPLLAQRTAMEEPVSRVVQILQSICDGHSNRKIEPETLLEDLNLDSLLMVELILRLEEEFEIQIEQSQIRSSMSIQQLEALVMLSKRGVRKKLLKWWQISKLAVGVRYLTSPFIWVFARLFINVKVEGLNNIKNISGPVIFMPNHVSYVDPIILYMALPLNFKARIAFAAAQDVLYVTYWYLVWIAELFINAFPFPRQEGQKITDGLMRMGTMLDKGFSVVVFPEGRVCETEELQQLRQGAGLIATQMRSPIVLVKLSGVQRLIPFEKFIPRHRGVITVKFGEPKQFCATMSLEQATQELQDALKKL